ncbi:MAG: ribonuclease PH [Bdellovibrionales bacterium]|nr:ribonuclease PH [Bdellovibrionales bacterium]
MILKRTNRAENELRPISIKGQINCWAEGSTEICMGQTKVLCTASVSESTPSWINKPEQGWVTAEYAMLPRAGDFRISRERAIQSGRSQEISRLIGRSLRASIDLSRLGERQILIDCDVLQADGGTRTAGITGGFVALALALKNLKDRHIIKEIPLKHYICAVSIGIYNQIFYLDLNAKEDKLCETDMNFVLNEKGEFIEIQGTAEKQNFTKKQMLQMMELAQQAGLKLIQKQKDIVGSFF